MKAWARVLNKTGAAMKDVKVIHKYSDVFLN
jgi:hypothetical protein